MAVNHAFDDLFCKTYLRNQKRVGRRKSLLIAGVSCIGFAVALGVIWIRLGL
jgi:hypothetical protein